MDMKYYPSPLKIFEIKGENKMIDGKTEVKVQNRDNGYVGYSIPDLNNLRRTYAPEEIKTVTVDELKKLSYLPGGMSILKDYLVILDEDVRKEILPDVEPEYYLSKEGIKELLLNGSLDALLDCLDFAPSGVIELIKSMAVEMELNDVAKRKAILEKTGFNVTSAIEFNHETEDEKDQSKPIRRLGEKVETKVEEPAGRRTSANYKVVSNTTKK